MLLMKLKFERLPGCVYFMKDGEIWSVKRGSSPLKLFGVDFKPNYVNFQYILKEDGVHRKRI